MMTIKTILVCECGVENDLDAKFCKTCGKSKENRNFLSFSESLKVKRNKCPKCGIPLTSNKCFWCDPIAMANKESNSSKQSPHYRDMLIKCR